MNTICKYRTLLPALVMILVTNTACMSIGDTYPAIAPGEIITMFNGSTLYYMKDLGSTTVADLWVNGRLALATWAVPGWENVKAFALVDITRLRDIQRLEGMIGRTDDLNTLLRYLESRGWTKGSDVTMGQIASQAAYYFALGKVTAETVFTGAIIYFDDIFETIIIRGEDL